MDDQTQNFYDQLAADYHLIFADWRQSVIQQGKILDAMIQAQSRHNSPLSILDCSCGIGTQAIGLAQQGYRVHGTDISPKSIEYAIHYASEMGVEVEFGVADFREVAQQVDGCFDVVISCDNALPHVLTDDDLSTAIQNMKSKLNAGGMLLISIRDYDELLKIRPESDPIRVFDQDGGRRITFQVWDWEAELPVYTVNHFILMQDEQNAWQTSHRQARYRALKRNELSQLLIDAGLLDVRWHMPTESGFYQPIVTAYKG